MTEKFPWQRLMQLGVCELRLSPSEFWNATLREISIAARSEATPPARETLEQLMKRFPDP